jgi:hypothetical protein
MDPQQCFQHCFICRHADANVLEDAGIVCGLHTFNRKMFTIEPRTGALIKPTTFALHWPQESSIVCCWAQDCCIESKTIALQRERIGAVIPELWKENNNFSKYC